MAIALLAGAAGPVAVRLGVGMLALQAAIGALNDVVDAPRDAGLKPGKPIPAGLVGRDTALALAGGAAGAGLALSLLSGPAVAGVALLILGVGALYDLRLKGTAWSWLPFALGLPLLPVYAWLGASGGLPAPFLVLLPAGFLAGGGLAIANSLADVERDRGAGVTSIADALGRDVAWRLHVALHGLVLALAAFSLFVAGQPAGLVAAAAGLPGVLLLAGAGLAGADDPGRRERGWELEALGVAALAISWLLVVPRTTG